MVRDILSLMRAKLQSLTYAPSAPYDGQLPEGLVKKGSAGKDALRCQAFLNWCVDAGLAADGIAGSRTVAAIKKYQKAYGLTVDGVFGTKSRRRAQQIVDAHASSDMTIQDRILQACSVQAEAMKGSRYKWEAKPVIERSRKNGTCVTYVACVLQRVGLLKPGQYIWHTDSGKVTGVPDTMDFTYMQHKELSSIRSEIRKGDVLVGGPDKAVGALKGGHIFVFTGRWSDDGRPFIYDNHSAECIRAGKSPVRAFSDSYDIIAVVRAK